MAGKKKSTLESLKGKAAMIGLDIEEVAAELVDRVIQKLPPAPQPADEAPLIEKVSAAVEERIATKLAQVLEAVKASTDGSKPDTEGIIKGVATLLQPQIVEAAKQASEAVFASNSQALLKQLREELQQANPGVGDNPGDGRVAPNTGQINIGSLLDLILKTDDKGNLVITQIINALRPQKSSDEKIAETIGGIFKWHNLLTRLEKGQADVNTLQQSLTEITTKKP